MGQEGRYRRTSSPNTSVGGGPNNNPALLEVSTGGEQKGGVVNAKEKFHQSLLRGVSPIRKQEHQHPEQQASTDSANPGKGKNLQLLQSLGDSWLYNILRLHT